MFDMMTKEKKFTILKSPNTDFKYIVVLNDYFTISDNISELSSVLKKSKISGTIVIDNLLSNNSLDNRFFKLDFDGNKILLNTYKQISGIDEKIKKLTIKYYHENFDKIVKNSILSKPIKFSIKKNISL